MENFKENRYHILYMDIAYRVSKMSHCKRLQVGAIAVKDGRIVSMGWNGQPTGFDNVCEDENNQTLNSVLHAESNLLTKIAKSHDSGEGTAIYLTHSPCIHCAKLMAQIGVNQIFYKENYRSEEGINFLLRCNIEVNQL